LPFMKKAVVFSTRSRETTHTSSCVTPLHRPYGYDISTIIAWMTARPAWWIWYFDYSCLNDRSTRLMDMIFRL